MKRRKWTLNRTTPRWCYELDRITPKWHCECNKIVPQWCTEYTNDSYKNKVTTDLETISRNLNFSLTGNHLKQICKCSVSRS